MWGKLMSDNSQPRILFLISRFYPVVGGGETHALLLSKQIKALGADVFVITRRQDKDLARFETIEGVDTYRIGPSGFGRIGKYLMLPGVFLKLLVLRRRYDIIFVSGLRLLGIPAVIVSMLTGKKCVLRSASCGELSGGFIWDSPHLAKKPVLTGLFRFCVRLRNRLFRRADGFLGISNAIVKEYRECGVPESKIRLINNGTDTGKYSPVGPDEKKELRQKLGLPGGKIFAYSGKLNKGKGLEFLLPVWRRVVDSNSEVHLALIGSGEGSFLSCERELRDYVARHGLSAHVTFTGYVRNVNEYLQCADVFVFPSQNESLSNALIEALACGLPCLASDIGGISDTVKDGVNGMLLDVDDEDQWLCAIRKVLNDPELVRKWGEAGRERVVNHNSIRRVAEKHMAYFGSVI